MNYKISHAESWDEFGLIWDSSLGQFSWFTDPNPADYNANIEREELINEFNDENHIYLIAKDEDGNGLGILEFTCRNNHARNGIMMPGVPDPFKYTNIGDALLEYQEYYLKNRGITTLTSSIKYASKQNVEWHFDTLQRNGFKMSAPEGYQMVVNLQYLTALRVTNNYEILTRKDFQLEDFIDFAIRSYASTPEDLQIHGWDEAVTNPEHIRAIHQRTIDGGFGLSPPEWWRVITKDDQPLGYILGFEINPDLEHRVGIIGNLGVFPEHRRKGLAGYLIHSLFNEFLKAGIEYARVGTPTINTRAIGAYVKSGFKEANRIQFFTKEL